MKIEFTTNEYLKAHGREPKGRGTWWFDLDGSEFCAFGTLTEAKAACRKAAKKLAADPEKPLKIKIMP